MKAENLLHLVDTGEGVSPFSNASEAMFWLDENCDQCRRSVQTRRPADTLKWEDGDYRLAVKKGHECGAKYALDCAWITGNVHPDIMEWISGSQTELCRKCRHFTSAETFDPEAPEVVDNPNQLSLFPSMYPPHLVEAQRLIYESLAR